MKLRSALLAATVVAMPFAASAQPVTGLYVGLGAGVGITQQEEVKNLSFPTLAPLGSGVSTSGNLNGGNPGFAGVVSMGWGFGNGLRAEIEGNYRYNHISGVTGFSSTAGALAGGSKEEKFGGMVNALYDFNGVCRGWCRMSASAWAGLGSTTTTTSIIRLRSLTRQSAVVHLRVAGQSTVGTFAYQAILGACVPDAGGSRSGDHDGVPLPRHDRQPVG